ncbi:MULTISPECIES: glycine betaine ABC transporter substrate-binding protein [Commensalibacter]|uniref:Glycine/betaine ABC transporter n=2 Tax=Commensalibacter TaxID=1079922 RepID=W7E3W2_9PROT|nr:MULTISPECIES: glycine betaine ABC transporter substrate-binding protein [Commensalibacter]EUK17736.1 glycine/betaine ABC transporter [Commensalibacter papalotli (ex Servin-Garciduenas et al. 2014)]CAI3944941.1 ABC-type proline/glycine betaine transport system [Commensalibacter papalotli (ex Botero et al. 2024)]CAI3945921.1 ABC-type proline/glycine betaine transport system [Commensalibacter papalotli (ex Botero et al. 2024)]
MDQECLALGFFDIPVHEAAAAAVLRVLEAHGIMDIELITGENAAMFQELSSGGIDIFTTLWTPDVHQDTLNSASSMKAIGNLYQPSLFLALPTKFKDRATFIDQLGLLSEIDRQVTVPETIYNRLQLVFESYGLINAGYSLKAIPDEEAISQYKDIMSSQENKIIALYSPSFIEDSDMMYKLQDPKNLLSEEQKAVILVKKDLIDSLGADLIDELEEMTLGNQVIKLMEQAMRVDGMDAHEAAEAWQRGKLVVRT